MRRLRPGVLKVLPGVLLVLLAAASTAFAQENSRPNSSLAFRLVREAEKQIEAKKFEDALRTLVEARQASSTIARVPFLMATCEYNLGVKTTNLDHTVRAKELIQECIKLDPDWGEPHFFFGFLSFAEGDYQVAVKGFQNALARAYLPKKSRVNLALSLFKWGVELSAPDGSNDDLSRGIRIFTDAVDRFAALKDDLRFGREQRKEYGDYWIDSLVNLVALLQRDEQYVEAERILNGLIALQPNNYLHHYNLGLVLGGTYMSGIRALDEYQKALDLCPDPHWIEPYPMIGYILSTRARTEEQELKAEWYFVEYLQQHPNALRALSRAGDHYRITAGRQPDERAEKRAGLWAKAARCFERCLEIDPRSIQTMLKLSEVLRAAKRNSEAARWRSLYDELRLQKGVARPADAFKPR